MKPNNHNSVKVSGQVRFTGSHTSSQKSSMYQRGKAAPSRVLGDFHMMQINKVFADF